MSLRFLTAGESHGPAIVGIIDGLPAGIILDKKDLAVHMKRRKQGYGRGSRQKIETDEVEILSGVRFGETMGTPISILIRNRDYKNWEDIMSAWGDNPRKKNVAVPRPGHADIIGGLKFQYTDLRNSLERASARETATRVALGYFAKVFLNQLDIQIQSRVFRIGTVVDESSFSWESDRIDETGGLCLETSEEMKLAIDQAKKEGESLGGSFEVRVKGLPIGLGSYSQWDRKVEAALGASLLSLNAMKSVEIGMGAESSKLKGSYVHDSMFWDHKDGLKFHSNHAGGLLAGVTNGEDLVIKAHMKPIATLMKPLKSFDYKTKEEKLAHVERSDYCAVPAASVIAESLVALDIAHFILEKFGSDSMKELKPRVFNWRDLCRS